MQRASGVLLSVTSLPSKYGIGCFSKEAYDFVDWLAKAGQTYWQILPLGVTSYGGADDSPYQSFSAFAGNPYMISLETLVEEGVLEQSECDAIDFGDNPEKVDYDKLHDHRLNLLHKAYERSNVGSDGEFQTFRRENAWWLDDYALFMALKDFFGGVAWTEWPQDIRMHWNFALDYYRRELYFDVEFHQFLQYKFFVQWQALKSYANEKGIRIIGDIPIYISMDSADAWAHPELFQLDENGQPSAIAGCPPDAFSEDGQVWGNPLYRWEYHKQTNFAWWSSRLWQCFRLYDMVRIDHFRGFDEYFSIPFGSATAKGGHWEPGPGMALFAQIEKDLGKKQFVAEDLGTMTDSVRKLVKDSGFPNMKVLQFAFDEDDVGAVNDYLPHNYDTNCVVYTGTHDNETLVGWLQNITPGQKKLVRDYLCDHHTSDDKLYRGLLALAMRSAARICILPIQDCLGLDNSARMNQPATVKTNWRWRLSPNALTKKAQKDLRTLTLRYGRFNWDTEKTEE